LSATYIERRKQNSFHLTALAANYLNCSVAAFLIQHNISVDTVWLNCLVFFEVARYCPGSACDHFIVPAVQFIVLADHFIVPAGHFIVRMTTLFGPDCSLSNNKLSIQKNGDIFYIIHHHSSFISLNIKNLFSILDQVK